MAQNIYDRQDFFDAYMKFIDRSSKETELESDPAWSRLSPLLPDVTGLDVLDLGCGSGWFCRWAVRSGARSVLGIDISENMLNKARTLTGHDYPAIEYRRADLETLQLPESDTNKFGLVFSSLTLHYLDNLARTMSLIHRVLSPGSLFVFNVEHPIYTAPRNPHVLVDSESQDKYWSFANYHEEGERVVDWLAKGVRKWHRTLTGYMDLIFGTGFSLVGFVEWLPKKEELARGTVTEEDQLRPLFLMMSVRKAI
ncbi:hypothetical protein jhhlp_007436 [Lomentospora prolificans]|uniref:Methyltransferase type 11 domain-containing protein n=1 Tax=Lomentospora prolificans TaxID=41688 RepID=A0A2N3N112_9PEZI|nr:hypothetical protein jhhlp_007436 [Lomentospora prolificans]